MTPNDRKRLIDLMLEDDISVDDLRLLEAELLADPSARKDYYDRVSLTVLLEAEAVGPVARPTDWHNRSSISLMAVSALAIALTGLLLSLFIFRTDVERVAEVAKDIETQVSGYAVIAGQANARWSNDQLLADGSLVPAGPLHLKSGIVQIELFSGVTVVMEGEAEFEVLSPMKVSVARGKLRAVVPEPAHGFRILTQQGDIVDLGTEFAVGITPEQSEVHVLEGEVEWHPVSSPMQVMARGNAIRSTVSGKVDLMPADESGFVGPGELRMRLSDARKVRRVAWEEYCSQLRDDARLIAHYRTATASDADRKLFNHASSENVNRAGEGTIVATSRSTDRWGRSGMACDFSPTGSRVRVSVPGTQRSLTLACWVKINSLDRWYNSLFLTDGHEAGEPHWQIMDDGRLFFSVKKRDKWDVSRGERDKHIYYSPRFWDSSLAGQWLLVATVYDVPGNCVKHYLNGKKLSEEAIPAEYLVESVRIGNASICNWGVPERSEPKFAVRNLNGSMDEFLLFSQPLSDNEVKSLYERSRP